MIVARDEVDPVAVHTHALIGRNGLGAGGFAIPMPHNPAGACIHSPGIVIRGEVKHPVHEKGRAGDANVASTTATWSGVGRDRKSTRLNSSHPSISYAVVCLKTK